MTVTVTPYKETDIGNAFWRDISFSKCDAIPSPYSFKLKGFPKTTTIVSFTIYFSYWGPNNIPPPPSPSLAKKMGACVQYEILFRLFFKWKPRRILTLFLPYQRPVSKRESHSVFPS